MSMTPPRARGPTEPCLDLRPLFIESGCAGHDIAGRRTTYTSSSLGARAPTLRQSSRRSHRLLSPGEASGNHRKHRVSGLGIMRQA